MGNLLSLDKDTITWQEGEVEVDVHQQVHKDYKGIKTAIHIRAAVDVTVKLPIAKNYLAEKDDFNIRVWTGYYVIGDSRYPIDVLAIHNDNNIVIKVNCVTPELLDRIKEETNGDGITVEIFSYYKNISDEDVWECLKNSVVETSVPTNIKGQITSAFYENEKVLF